MNPRAPRCPGRFATALSLFSAASLRMAGLKLAFLFLLVGLLATPLQAQPPVTTLSPEAQVSVLTCSPGTELYSVFGHSALRIQDPATRLDWVWN
ncbi:MAG TPA: hypothetical protein VHS96_13465, partial [Bacteroidia bacterium]|nr:hypothetical protein [Bacteroidia bacterium]